MISLCLAGLGHSWVGALMSTSPCHPNAPKIAKTNIRYKGDIHLHMYIVLAWMHLSDLRSELSVRCIWSNQLTHDYVCMVCLRAKSHVYVSVKYASSLKWNTMPAEWVMHVCRCVQWWVILRVDAMEPTDLGVSAQCGVCSGRSYEIGST